MNKEQCEQAIADGNITPLNLKIQEDGKKGGPIKDMPLTFREMFHRSITKMLKEIPQSELDWHYQITDEDEPGPLKYQLHFFHNGPGDPEFVVVCRVGTYDMVTKEVLPDDQDKIFVFKFKNVDDLL